jgi:hypothetical protein
MDQASPDPTNVTNWPIATARLLAGTVLALFALLFFAGLSAASERVRDARAGQPVGCSVRNVTARACGSVLTEHPTNGSKRPGRAAAGGLSNTV